MTTWMEMAACRGRTGDMEYHGSQTKTDIAHNEQAKRICAGCPVTAECRRWALGDDNPAEHMIAGGLTPLERDRLTTYRPGTATYLVDRHDTPPLGARNAAKTHCPQGHPYDDGNTSYRRTRTGSTCRVCITCRREHTRKHKRAKRGA